MVGCAPGDLIARPLLTALPGLRRTPLAGWLARVRGTGAPFTTDKYTLCVAPHGPELTWTLALLPLAGSARTPAGIVLLASDLVAQQDTGNVDPQAEREAFLSLISHEIKTPLTAIKGFAQLAQRAAGEGDAPDERVARHLRIIDQQIERLGQLVGDLSDAARLEHGGLQLTPADCDLAALVRAAAARQQVAAPSHQIALTLPAIPPLVHADPARLEQALNHLLANAVRFSPGGEAIAVTLTSEGASAHLTVRDRGIGIPRAELPLLFGRFYRASNGASGGFSGLGLGLYLARAIVARSGGRIYAESAERQGSAFHVILPLVNGDE